MTDLEPQISVMLDRLVPMTDDPGEWERVLADAGATSKRGAGRWRSRRRALVLAMLAALAAGLAFVPALAGQGYFWFLAHGPEPTTSVVTVTSLTDRSGTTWLLTAYRDDKGLCYQLTSTQKTGVGVGACGSEIPLNAVVYGAGDAQGTLVYGPVTPDAQRVEITGSGEHVDAAAVAAPEALQTDTKFYVAQLPAGMPGAPLTLKALDAQDHSVATWAVPAMRTP